MVLLSKLFENDNRFFNYIAYLFLKISIESNKTQQPFFWNTEVVKRLACSVTYKEFIS